MSKFAAFFSYILVQVILLNSSCSIKNTNDFIEVREIDTTGQYKFSEIPFNPGKTAIVVVDMWGLGGCGYFNPDSSFVGTTEGFLYSENVSKKLNVLLASARALGVTIIHAPSDQTIYYENHPVRTNVKKIPGTDYPWDKKPIWNDDQKKIPYGNWYGYEYEYMYPGMDWNTNRPGTKTYGQNPHIVLDKEDFMTDDPEELWKIIKARDLVSIIYVGGSTNMCLAGRPFGLLNMQKYGLDVYLDRNYSHVIHRIPHGWNGDANNPKYGSEYTNRQNSKKVIRYYEQNICPTLDGEDIIKLSVTKDLQVDVLKPKLEQSFSSIQDITISFQPQHMEIPEGVVVDCGWKFTKQPCGLSYGWQQLKVKDTYRTGYDGLMETGIKTLRNNQWSLQLPKAKYSIRSCGSKRGKIKIQDTIIDVGCNNDQWNIQIDVSNNNELIEIGVLTDQVFMKSIHITSISN